MANSLAVILRRVSVQLPKNFVGFTGPCLIDTQIRTLYAPAALGIDAFEQQRVRIKNQFASMSDKFITKMKEFTSEDSKGMIFTEDLKNMIHLAETDEDIDLVVKMIKRFAKQNSSMRFGSYVYGPVAMRMFHYYKKPDIALECFKDPEVGNVFNQLITYQILLDLLHTSGKYKEVLEAFEVIKGRQIEGAKYPKNVIVLVYASLYKMNTKESLDYALKLHRELKEHGHNLMRRAVTFCAALAINQGDPANALEVLALLQNPNYVTVRNLKALAFCDVGRLDDTVPILKSIITHDVPQRGNKQTFCADVMEKLRQAFETCDNTDLKLEFNRIDDILKSQGHISDTTLDEFLTAEIAPNVVPYEHQRGKFERYSRLPGDRQERGRSFEYRKRPGLAELQ